jgi:hypothetical protein
MDKGKTSVLSFTTNPDSAIHANSLKIKAIVKISETHNTWHKSCKSLGCSHRMDKLIHSWRGGPIMKVAAITKTMVGRDTSSLVGALSTSWVACLSALRSKLQQQVEGKPGTHNHPFAPQSASTSVMLVESDLSSESHEMLP